MNNIHKQAFQVVPTAHPNAAYGQAGQAKEWLNAVLTQIARETTRPDDPSMTGRTVTVTVEVIES